MNLYKLPHEKDTFKIYQGRIIIQMPNLIVDNRIPANISQIMERRLDFAIPPFSDERILNKSNLVKTLEEDWNKYYKTKEEFLEEFNRIKRIYTHRTIDSGDAIAYHPRGKIKIILDSIDIREINPLSKRKNGYFIITEKDYNRLQGEEFKENDLEKYGDGMSISQIKSNPLLKILSRNKEILDRYTKYIFNNGELKFKKAMGFYINENTENCPLIMPLHIWGLDMASHITIRGHHYNDYCFIGLKKRELNH